MKYIKPGYADFNAVKQSLDSFGSPVKSALPDKLWQCFLCLSAILFLGLPVQGVQFSLVHSFNFNDGNWPCGALAKDSNGTLYGTTYKGGLFDNGTVFKITQKGVFAVLHSFTTPVWGNVWNNDGYEPNSGLIRGADGAFYGTTWIGGAYSDGVVFRISGSGSFSTLRAFGENYVLGSVPEGLALGADGNLYGVAENGGQFSAGAVFRITAQGGFQLLHSFNGVDGSSPSGIVQGRDGLFYGTTVSGGASDYGTIFKMTPGGGTTNLYSFSAINGWDGNMDGALPSDGLVEGRKGEFYGVCSSGGKNDLGTVFRIMSDGAFTTLHSFGGKSGGHPEAGLILGSDGAFYGTTTGGGEFLNATGTVFRITRSGILTTLHSFDSKDGFRPDGRLIEGSGGAFFGTTRQGGLFNCGTVFKITMPLQQPDIMAGVSQSSTKGDGIYNATGAKQTLNITLKPGQKKTAYVIVENDGMMPDEIGLKGSGSGRYFSLQCFKGKKNVTGKMLEGTLTTDQLAPGGSCKLKVVVVGLKSCAGKKVDIRIQSRSKGASNRTDTVIIRAKGKT